MYGATQMRYLVREAFLGLARRRISGSVAVLIMGSALLMLALFSIITINLDAILQSLRGNVDAEAFLEEGLEEGQRQNLQQELLSLDGVDAVYFISPKQAIEEFRRDLGEDASLLDVLDENPLPASFRIRLAKDVIHDADRMEELLGVIGRFPGVDEVVSQVDLIRHLDHLGRVFVIVDLVVGLLVLISAIFVISNTVRLTVEERARSIDIMKQVGATNWFIRMPFLLSGALQGALAGALAMGLLMIAHRVLQNEVGGVYFFGPGQIVGFIVLSTLLGAVGSATALRRHLRI